MVRSRSYIATPPGATIKEQLNDRGMSQKEFAARMDMSEKHISKLINGDVQLTPETAVKLEMVLGVPAKFWNNLEAIYRNLGQPYDIRNFCNHIHSNLSFSIHYGSRFTNVRNSSDCNSSDDGNIGTDIR